MPDSPIRTCRALIAALLLQTVTAPDTGAQQLSQVRASASLNGATLVHESWSVADGLPVNSINQIIQTRDGYIWAATFDGLVRFDGVRFTVFNMANSGLPSARIIWVQEGVAGELWLFTEQLHIVRMQRGRFTTIGRFSNGGGQQKPLLTDAAGTTWVGTEDGLARVIGDSLVPVARDVIRDTVLSLFRRRDGSLMVGLLHAGLMRLRTTSSVTQVAEAVPIDSALQHSSVSSMAEDAQGVLWAGTLDGDVLTGNDALHRLPIPRVVAAHRDPILAILAKPQGGVVVRSSEMLLSIDSGRITLLDDKFPRIWQSAQWSDGVATWHANGPSLYRDGKLVFALSPGGGARLLPTDIVTGMIDREGSIWLGTSAAGLHRLKRSLFHTISLDDGLPDQNVYATYADRDGTIWVGSLARGYSRINPSTGVIRSFASQRSTEAEARSFLQDRLGSLWLGLTASLYRCSRTSAHDCAQVQPDRGRITRVLALHEDTDGRIWIGDDAGLFRFENDRLLKLPDAPGAPKAPVRAFASALDGSIWMGTAGGGVTRYRDGSFTTITIADGLPSDLIRALHVDRDGWLWIGTEGHGLARLDPRGWAPASRDAPGVNRRIANITVRTGLFDNVIHQILEDDAQRLWMSTNRGIFWIDRVEAASVADGRVPRVHSTGYTERDGMRNREANGGTQPSGAKAPDGRLWFPTQDGVVVVDPKDVGTGAAAPPLVIEQVVSGDSSIAPTDGRVLLTATQRDVRIEYTALTFLEPRNVRFRYQLAGYDNDWVDASERRSAFYTKLPAGTYTFRVQSSSGGADWSEPGASVTVTVPPYFWETWLFRLLCAAALASGVFIEVRRRVRAARARARALEALVSERTATLRERERELASQNVQLEAQAEELQRSDTARSRFFANVSHELRTPLTLTIGPLEALRDKAARDPQSQQWLDIALRNARRLVTLVNQILDVARLEAGAMRLAPQPLDLCGFLRGLIGTFQPVAERKNLVVQLDAPTECSVMLDPDALEKIFTNLLSNAVKFTPPDGVITSSLALIDGGVRLVVHNTGPAIPAELLARVFERFYRVDESNTSMQPGTGIGLSLVKELVELHGGTVTAASTASGTTFTVTLPAMPVPAAVGNVATPTVEPTAAEDASERGLEATDEDAHDDIPTLLIVDDSEDLRTFIRANFIDRFRVLEAADGHEGLALARAELPDVVLSDVMMPGMDGRALVRALRDDPDTEFLSIVLLTAQADSAQKIAGLEVGADDYLVKPFEMRELDLRVRNLIAARQRLRLHLRSDAPQAPASRSLPMESMEVVGSFELVAPERATVSISVEERDYVERVTRAIQAGLADPDFGVQELADAVFQDRTHLFRRVRKATGLSPSDLLRRARLECGAQLLANGDGTVADVAFTVGFRSVSHFCRSFNAQYGMTPATYRATVSVNAPSAARGMR